MGYFSNGNQGDQYEAQWCARCMHHVDEPETFEDGCAVWDAHMFKNYDDCNDPHSILHMLIPRQGIENEPCRMFIEREVVSVY